MYNEIIDIKGKNFPSSLDSLVIALCLDYTRRSEDILADKASKRTLMEYRYINYRMEDAAMEIVGVKGAELFIKEIGKKIGYAYSGIDFLSETAYKQQKREVKINIARKLHLLD